MDKVFSQTTEKIIQYLAKNIRRQDMTALEISQKTGIAVAVVNGTLTGLQKQNYVRREHVAKNTKHIIITPIFRIDFKNYLTTLTVKIFTEALQNIDDIDIELLNENEYLKLTPEQFKTIELAKEMI